MYRAKRLTPICRIGSTKPTGDEWASYSKKFTVNGEVEYATIELESDGVCGIYLNGEFVEGHMGRLPGRVFYAEITSKLCEGENEIKLEIGGLHHQPAGEVIRERRGFYIHDVAAELKFRTAKETGTIVTDGTWTREADDGVTVPDVVAAITEDEYHHFWRHAALWREVPEVQKVPEAVETVAGKAYTEFLNKNEQGYVYPKHVMCSNILPVDAPAEKPSCIEDGEQYALYDFEQVEVGYTEIEYELEEDAEILVMYDYSESLTDFSYEIFHWSKYKYRNYWPETVQRLILRQTLKKGRGTLRFTRRRACHFMLVRFKSAGKVKVHSCRILRSMMPVVEKGYFHCDDELFNRMWEVGRYTLQVNRHQEYESEPRNESKFFSGDGCIDTLTEYYTFNDSSIIDASLSHTDPGHGGRVSNVFMRNKSLPDYHAWRIILLYNHYRYTGDVEFVKHYYEDLHQIMIGLLNMMGPNNLIYNSQIYGDIFFFTSGSIDYTCSFDRLGYKIYMNALFYRSLIAMSELGEVVGEESEYTTEWRAFAAEVKKAVNELMWDEMAGAYLDSLFPDNLSQDGNALAVLYGLADGERAESIMAAIKERNWTPCGSRFMTQTFENLRNSRGGGILLSPAMNTYEAEGRFLMGQDEDAIELMRRCWGAMIRKGAHTFWEFAPTDENDVWPTPAHAWASGCCYLMGAYIAGVRPATPGYETVLLAPTDAFGEFEAVVPTNKGYIAANCRITDGKKIFTYAVPETMKIETKMPEGVEWEIIRY